MRHRQSTDPRDKIFAVMGLAEQPIGTRFEVDYSIPVEKIFQRLLDAILIQDGNLACRNT